MRPSSSSSSTSIIVILFAQNLGLIKTSDNEWPCCAADDEDARGSLLSRTLLKYVTDNGWCKFFSAEWHLTRDCITYRHCDELGVATDGEWASDVTDVRISLLTIARRQTRGERSSGGAVLPGLALGNAATYSTSAVESTRHRFGRWRLCADYASRESAGA